MGGVVVESGRFPWDNGNFPQMTEPSRGYHGVRFYETFGDFGFTMKARMETMRTLGATLSPMSAFLLLQGIETLHLRMPRHVEATRKVVQFLAAHAAVAQVIYPELPRHPDHALAKKLLPKGAGAVFSFEIKGGRAAGKAFIESLRIFSHLANVGDAKSLVIHPATTTHYRMSDADLQKAGITAGTVRLSIGLEDPQDLIDDLDRALRAAHK
jgi:O-acetylhomoserine (thiol)-lyase